MLCRLRLNIAPAIIAMAFLLAAQAGMIFSNIKRPPIKSKPPPVYCAGGVNNF
jgi:hypothetical protein